jgi:hypothetical protein
MASRSSTAAETDDTVDELAGFLEYHSTAGVSDLPTTRYGMPANEFSERLRRPTLSKTEDLWRAMLADGSYPDGESGRHAVAVLVAANLSGESGGRSVALGKGLPLERKFMWA